MWEMMKKIITVILITLMLMTVATTFIGRIDEYFANNRLSARELTHLYKYKLLCITILSEIGG